MDVLAAETKEPSVDVKEPRKYRFDAVIWSMINEVLRREMKMERERERVIMSE